MFELLMFILFCWLFFWGIGVSFKVAWGFTKILAIMLFIVAVPSFIGLFMLAGGLLLLLPIAPVLMALILLKLAG